MALETTSSTQSALINTEVISQAAIKANLPALPFIGLAHHDNVDGASSNTKNYLVESDLGTASGGTEGVDVTPTVQLTYGSSVAATPTEGVLDMALITEDTVMRRLGGMGFQSVRDVFASENDAAIQRLLAPDIQRMAFRGMRKIHSDGLQLMAGASNTVGSSGSDMTILNLLQARYQLKTQKPHLPPSRWAYILTTNQVFEAEQIAIATSGGLAGTMWSSQADYGMLNSPGDEWSQSGLIGTFLRHPVYEINEDEAATANAAADVCGALACIPANIETPPDAPVNGGKVGAYCLTYRHMLAWAFEFDASMRSLELICNARYIWSELVDSNHVGIVTDAP